MKIECAVDGLKNMDPVFMNKKLDELIAKYKADPTKTNVKYDKNTWTISYDEVEKESVKVKVEDQDKVL